ncbi:MAG: NAD(P)/FAD-dependent oxidoreductase [Phycisphaerales bacterium]
MSSAKHILIVGGGVIGLCTAHYCRRAGHQVTLLERGGPDHDCCSLGNAGYVSPSHFIPLAAPGMVWTGLRMMRNPRSPFYIKPRLSLDLMNWGWKFMRACTPQRVERAAPVLRDLNLHSRACYEELSSEWAARGEEFGFTKRGLLMLCKTEQALEHERHLGARGKQLGVPGEFLSPQETAKVEPNLKADILGSVFFPDDCHLTPRKFVPGLAESVQRDGVEIRWNSAAIGWETTSGSRGGKRRVSGVRTAAGTLEADEYVIAGGSWTPSIGRALGVRLPMQAGKGYSLTMSNPPASKLPSTTAILTEARVAVTPMSGTLRFGGTMEIAGMDESITMERVRGIIEAVPKYLPEFSAADFEGIPPWRGLRPVTPDGLPYVGRFGAFENASVAAGHAMLGLSLGPITGKLMSQILSGQLPLVDTTLLDPDRYA